MIQPDGKDLVTGELVHRAVEMLHRGRAAADELGHDFAHPLRADGRGHVHRAHDVGE